jgi:hypothetical protein
MHSSLKKSMVKRLGLTCLPQALSLTWYRAGRDARFVKVMSLVFKIF